eukprot:TRINITY_DN4577_c0_g2_i5.p1 TRINITY_DN4577_c0_g2~~TRINITY_DN4577_c0_g2_i5.p1  ORF type:complete len:554 (+),score=103.11 TRINITY_DN4577_c0_g2_i5:75-1736(+)
MSRSSKPLPFMTSISHVDERTTFETLIRLQEEEKKIMETEVRMNRMLADLAAEPFEDFVVAYKSSKEMYDREKKEYMRTVTRATSTMDSYMNARTRWVEALEREMEGGTVDPSILSGPFVKYLKQNDVMESDEAKPHSSTEQHSEPSSELVWGEFEIGVDEVTCLEKIGSGAFGLVWKGICRQKLVAVKTLKNIDYDPKIFENLKREIMFMQAHSHQNILLFMGACVVPNHYCLVTELAQNGSLKDLIHKPGDKKILFIRKMRMADEVAAGMNWLHKSKPPLLHLDLKPENLLLMSDWTVKIADFGMSRFRVDIQGENHPAESQSLGGTPLYMPPEMFDIKPIPTEKCDVYAFAILLWELFVQKVPFQEYGLSSLPALISAICSNVRPTIPEGTPVLLSKFFSFGWNPKADLRPSFEQIVNEKLFDKIVTQVLSDGEEDIKSLCLSLKLSIDVEQIPWDRFVEAYCEVFGHDPKLCTIQFENLQAYLNVDVRGNQKILQVSNLYKFIEWWKPIKGASSPVSTLDELIATMKERNKVIFNKSDREGTFSYTTTP